jgi:hypothetical protein
VSTLITGTGEHEVDASLRLTSAQLLAATEWELKPEGLCRGDSCVPTRSRPDLEAGGRVDLRVVADLLRRPLAIDDATGAAALGESAAARAEQLGDCRVDDLVLRDLAGNLVEWGTLGRKKKVLVTWASW